jgi:hypothetical protein
VVSKPHTCYSKTVRRNKSGTVKQLTILILLAVYLLATAWWTVYHSFNFSDYVHRKGDETLDYTLYLLLTSIIFQGLIWTISKVLDWKFAVLGTIVNYIFSFILGFGILTISGLSGIPRHLIFIYGACYMTMFTIVTILQSNRVKN